MGRRRRCRAPLGRSRHRHRRRSSTARACAEAECAQRGDGQQLWIQQCQEQQQQERKQTQQRPHALPARLIPAPIATGAGAADPAIVPAGSGCMRGAGNLVPVVGWLDVQGLVSPALVRAGWQLRFCGSAAPFCARAREHERVQLVRHRAVRPQSHMHEAKAPMLMLLSIAAMRTTLRSRLLLNSVVLLQLDSEYDSSTAIDRAWLARDRTLFAHLSTPRPNLVRRLCC